MKRKKYKLQKTTGYVTIFAMLGGTSYRDNLPLNYGKIVSTNQKTVKTSKGFAKIRRKDKKIKSED